MARGTVGTMPLRIRRLSPSAVLPRYHSARASGMDLHAAIEEPLAIAPGEIVKVPCGFAMALPAGHEAQIRPRSGLATAHGITLPNAPATIAARPRAARAGSGARDSDSHQFPPAVTAVEVARRNW